MLRTDLVEKLSLVEAGLSKNDLIPILSHLWFTGSMLITYNDQIAISCPLKTDFGGAVPGKIMIELLKSSHAKEVEFEPTNDGNELTIKAGKQTSKSGKVTYRSNYKLAMLEPDAFAKLFEMPKPSKNDLGLPKEFFTAVSSCMQSVGSDPSTPEQLGVTLVPDGKDLMLFSTDNATVTYNRITLKEPLDLKDGRVTLSSEFCKEMISIAKTSDSVKVEIHDDYSLLTTADGISLFGRLIEIDRPLDFGALLDQNVPENIQKAAVPFPARLPIMIETAILLTKDTTEKSHTTITVENGRLTFFSKSSRGEGRDRASLPDHPDVSLDVDCKHLKPVLGAYDKILITDRCLIMLKGKSIYMVAGTHSK